MEDGRERARGIDDVKEGGSGGREGGLRKGTSEEGTELGMDERGKEGKEEASEGGRERGARNRSGGGREIGREGNFKGCTLMRTMVTIQYTLPTTTHNVALALETLVLGMKNSEQV